MWCSRARSRPLSLAQINQKQSWQRYHKGAAFPIKCARKKATSEEKRTKTELIPFDPVKVIGQRKKCSCFQHEFHHFFTLLLVRSVAAANMVGFSNQNACSRAVQMQRLTATVKINISPNRVHVMPNCNNWTATEVSAYLRLPLNFSPAIRCDAFSSRA